MSSIKSLLQLDITHIWHMPCLVAIVDCAHVGSAIESTKLTMFALIMFCEISMHSGSNE